MKEITIVDLDLAKQVFQVHGVGPDGITIVNRQLRRSEVLAFFGKLPPCLIGMEACGGAHDWAREISALGHDVRLMPPSYVKPYLKRGKTDAADAEAICEAVTRPTMRFVPIKSTAQQSAAMVLKTRDLLLRQCSQAINALRSHLSELGIVTGLGVGKVSLLIEIVCDTSDTRLPKAARLALCELSDQIEALTGRIVCMESEIVAEVRRDEEARRLATIPGVGPISAASIKALVPDPKGVRFRAPLRRLAWIDTKTVVKRWQRAARRDIEDGQYDTPNTPDPGGNNGSAARAAGRTRDGMGHCPIGAAPIQGCGRCAR